MKNGQRMYLNLASHPARNLRLFISLAGVLGAHLLLILILGVIALIATHKIAYRFSSNLMVDQTRGAFNICQKSLAEDGMDSKRLSAFLRQANI